MVSQERRAAASRARLLRAAAAEFEARGFAGAKIQRIAARARLNKAMIYYHFTNKAALYREVLAGVFHTIAEAVAAEATAGPPDDQLRHFVRAIAREVADQPHFAAMWLRELADGGGHIDGAILAQVRRILQVLDTIIQRGVSSGVFQTAHPLVVQVGIVGPILMLAASAPARARLARRGEALASPTRDDFLRHLERATLGALHGAEAPAKSRKTASRRPRT